MTEPPGRKEPSDASSSSRKPLRVAVVGGGIAGSTIALRLCEANRLESQLRAAAEGYGTSTPSAGSGNLNVVPPPLFETTLFEAGPSLVDGPPFCHLHAGGNLYREINDAQCAVLLKQCIDTMRVYGAGSKSAGRGNCIFDRRPTVLMVPTWDTMRGGAPHEGMTRRLRFLQLLYADMLKYGTMKADSKGTFIVRGKEEDADTATSPATAAAPNNPDAASPSPNAAGNNPALLAYAKSLADPRVTP